MNGEDPFAAEREEAFIAALCDDFNTPRALAAAFELVAEANRRPVPGARARSSGCFRCLGSNPCSHGGEEAPRKSKRFFASVMTLAQLATSSVPTGPATALPSWASRSATRPKARGSCAVAEVVYGAGPSPRPSGGAGAFFARGHRG